MSARRESSGTIRRVSPGRAVLVVLLTLTVTACGWGKDTTTNGIEKRGDGELRTELAPLVDRLPQLAGATSAEWMIGTLGGRLSPGPSTYWIDAVLVLDDTTLQEVSALPGLAVAEPPKVVKGLKPSLPDGELLRSEALDEYFTLAPWRGEAWLSPDEGQVVLLVIGGPN
ncbi:MAG: hypothetical protein Q4P15_08960 [Propionibacteriaceae bacterium]|nr:hypothetical protein [Propionibacteriaceae bacterium]